MILVILILIVVVRFYIYINSPLTTMTVMFNQDVSYFRAWTVILSLGPAINLASVMSPLASFPPSGEHFEKYRYFMLTVRIKDVTNLETQLSKNPLVSSVNTSQLPLLLPVF